MLGEAVSSNGRTDRDDARAQARSLRFRLGVTSKQLDVALAAADARRIQHRDDQEQLTKLREVLAGAESNFKRPGRSSNRRGPTEIDGDRVELEVTRGGSAAPWFGPRERRAST